MGPLLGVQALADDSEKFHSRKIRPQSVTVAPNGKLRAGYEVVSRRLESLGMAGRLVVLVRANGGRLAG